MDLGFGEQPEDSADARLVELKKRMNKARRKGFQEGYQLWKEEEKRMNKTLCYWMMAFLGLGLVGLFVFLLLS